MLDVDILVVYTRCYPMRPCGRRKVSAGGLALSSGNDIRPTGGDDAHPCRSAVPGFIGARHARHVHRVLGARRDAPQPVPVPNPYSLRPPRSLPPPYTDSGSPSSTDKLPFMTEYTLRFSPSAVADTGTFKLLELPSDLSKLVEESSDNLPRQAHSVRAVRIATEGTSV